MTQQLSVEELLKPRYKVIADWPDCPFEIGEYLYQPQILFKINKYPHLFKRLDWWEERDFDLVGMYVRFGELNKTHAYYQLKEPLEGCYGFWSMKGKCSDHCYPISGSHPATEAEYLTFLNQQQ